MSLAARLPAIPALPAREQLALRENAIAGVVVGVVAIPLSIALAVAIGAPPIAGLYTAVIAGAIAAIFGGSRFNITGPTAALVPVLAHATLLHGVEALPLLAMMSGVLLLIMGRLGAGRLIRLIPGTVVIGFTAGIALSIAFGQLNAFLAVRGTDPSLEHFHEKLFDTLTHLGSVGFAAPAIGLLSIATLLAWVRHPTLRRVPAPLVAVVLATALTWGFDMDVPTIRSNYGALPRSVPTPSFEFLNLGLMWDLVPIAVSIAILAGIESLLSAVVADGMAGSGPAHDPTKELRGQGLANIATAVFGGIPATAAIARTGTGIRSGATNRLTGVFHSMTVLVAIVALGGLAGNVPLTALAAVLLVTAWNIGDVPEVKRLLLRAPREDAVVLLATMLVTLFFDITYAVAFGVLASMILLVRRLMQVPAVRELLPDETGRIRQVSPELAKLIESRPDIACFTASELLSFHSAATFENVLSGRANDPLILRMRDVMHIDTTGLLRLEQIIEHRRSLGQRVVLTSVQPEVAARLNRFGLIERLGRENVFEHTRCAIADIPARHRDDDRHAANFGLPHVS